MQTMDVVVLVGYFVLMVIIGILCSRKIRQQEDFFMGGRGFGKLLQTFAAFGAGTGSQDPINVGRTTWTSGLSGVWSALMWLFVTPFYWIFGVWYRRMRHITLGDWYVERYESRAMGVAYTLCGLAFYMVYLSTMFSAISKVAAPLLGEETVQTLVGLVGSSNPDDLKFILVPIIALVVIAYGVVGGLAAAYWTDLIQGLCIIVLSLILIPYGLWGLVEKFGDPATMTARDGFTILHERVPPENFQLFGGPRAGEFPLHYIISLSVLGLVGIVVQPHFIATGGGSAKTENAARVGLVTGNFLKRFCTIGWALTALIVLALLADSVEIAKDPDEAWGVASREILGQVNVGGFSLGLVGLMLACLLAALMSSADCYMLVTSALLIHNVYAPYINPNASEQTYVRAGRIAGLLIILGASIVSLILYDVFGQYTLALEVPIIVAAPFWIGMFWRRATKAAAWLTMLFSLSVFFVVPLVVPAIMPGLRDNPDFNITNDMVTTRITRAASPADVAKREAEIAIWEEAGANEGQPPQPIQVGDPFVDTFKTGGKPIFWASMKPKAQTKIVEVRRDLSDDGNTERIFSRYEADTMQGDGSFNLDYLLYRTLGMDLTEASDAMLTTLRLPPRLISPFLVMILLSLVTRAGSKEALDRYYVKMKTPVDPDREEDRRQLEESYRNPARFDEKRLLPSTNLEFQKPTRADVIGFLISVGVCVAFLALAVWLANIGA